MPDNETIEEAAERIFASVSAEEWAKLPEDLTDNLDHYLYGCPKEDDLVRGGQGRTGSSLREAALVLAALFIGGVVGLCLASL